MTKDEIIEKLITTGIVLQVAEEYYLTEKYKEVGTIVAVPDVPIETELDYTKLLNPKTAGKNWPVGILENTGRKRFACFMDVSDIPTIASQGYRLRGADKESINILSNIVDDADICPPTMLDAVRMYYKYTEMPKAFKNLVIDGDILDLYEEHIKGTLKKTFNLSDDKSNQTWN